MASLSNTALPISRPLSTAQACHVHLLYRCETHLACTSLASPTAQPRTFRLPLSHRYGAHPLTLTQPDFLYAFYAAARSTFVAAGAEGDFFWTGLVPPSRYDPTQYAESGRGSRASVLEELAAVAARSPSWREQSQFVSSPGTPVDDDYLINWHYLRLAAVNTSAGHPVALPAGASPRGAHSAASMRLHVRGSCDYSPAPSESLQRLQPEAWTCDAGETCPAGRYVELGVLGSLVAGGGLLLVATMMPAIKGLARCWRAPRSLKAPLLGGDGCT